MDITNALFEFGGFLAVLMSIRAILRDQSVAGFSPYTTIFFTAWGCWNMAYYPHLDQWWSALAAALLTFTNTVYLCLVWYFRRKAVVA